MNADRIKEIQAKTAYPDSISVQQALMQVWNECEPDAGTSHPGPLEVAWRCPDCGVIAYAGQYHDCKGTALLIRLVASNRLINDCLAVFYSEWVDAKHVAEAHERVNHRGGMLAYIADVLKDNKAALHEGDDVPMA